MNKACRHSTLAFAEGGLYVLCRDCGQKYVKVQRGSALVPDLMGMSDGLSEIDVRQDPHVQGRAG